MSHKTNLEAHIRESYKLIQEYEGILRLSDVPKEKLRAQRTIEEQWTFIKGYADEYVNLCKLRQLNVADDIAEILAHFSEYTNLKGSQIQETSFPESSNTTGSQVKETSSQQSAGAIEVFFSYTHEDEAWRKKLEKSLSAMRREGLIQGWHDRNILAGSEWKREIMTRLNTAPIILLLVSQDFIDSDFCWNVELQQAMQRHKEGTACVIPIIVRPSDWKKTPFAQLQALPQDGMPISTWSNEDEALLQVARGIRHVIEGLK
jgi:hypothetical protein